MSVDYGKGQQMARTRGRKPRDGKPCCVTSEVVMHKEDPGSE